MAIALLVFATFAMLRTPRSGSFYRISLVVGITSALVVLGFDLANRSTPHWLLYPMVGVMLALLSALILSNEDGQRDRLIRWYLRIPQG
jgi:hypothetical protein